ncbi:HNH endonuclease, partial [Acinetobacter baumannii]
YETYEICGIIDQIIRNPFDYLVKLEGFYCDEEWLFLAMPYEKYSILHKFIEYVLDEIHSEQADEYDLEKEQRIFLDFQGIPEALKSLQPTKLPIELAFDYYEIKYESFIDYIKQKDKKFIEADQDDIDEFMSELYLTNEYEKLINQRVKEIFHILFMNRQLLLTFNSFLSSIIEKNINNYKDDIYNQDLLKKLFDENGKLKRINPPKWAQRAVYYRDRGQCTLCKKDLTGLINLANIKNFDHMIPLNLHGLNDITNLQLLCIECNQQEKRDKHGYTSNKYQTWYSYKKS